MSERMIRGITFDLWHTVLREPMENFTDFLKKKRSKAMMEILHDPGL
jgi:FMN phosphatase YigB (HAD superfamily)